MPNRPILRFPNPERSERRTGAPRNLPRSRGPGRAAQGRRFQATFDQLSAAFGTDDPIFNLRQDPTGIAPERALVFVTAGNIQNFARAAQEIGLEVIAETDLEDIEDFPEGFHPSRDSETLSRTLYATMPTLESFRQIMSLWNAHQNDERAPTGAAPWWALFDLLLDLRPWGPEDRLSGGARQAIENRLPLNEDEEVFIEFEIWPTAHLQQRQLWREQTEQRITAFNGRVLDKSSISGDGFIYEAVLASLPAHVVRDMLDDPDDIQGLATLEGIQFIMPQMIGQAEPGDPQGPVVDYPPQGQFVPDAPLRAALLDGTPVAGQAALDGGVVIEDVHDLVRLSLVNHRYHGTAMASLILRGDLEADGIPLQDARLVAVPILVDNDSGGAWTPNNMLFVDLVHSTLTQLMASETPLARDVFVVNFSIGIRDMRFAGRISSLARLIDWWAAKEGVLFVISAGNISEGLYLSGITSVAFEDSNDDERRRAVRGSLRASIYDRTLLAPAESLNALAVGAISKDLNGRNPHHQAGIMTLENDGEILPQLTSALGLGPHRIIKPDLVAIGGRQEFRPIPQGAGTILRHVEASQRTGLVASAPIGGADATQKSRGTSPAAALVTRAVLQSAEALTGPNGPFEGQELPRRDMALLTRALAINSARWPEEAHQLYAEEQDVLGSRNHARAKEEVCRYFGYGVMTSNLMQHSPDAGVTMVGLGSLRKDQAQIFRMPLPYSMSGDRIPRSMRVTLAWFSPVNSTRAQYRLAGLEAVAAEEFDEEDDKQWVLDLKTEGPDANIVKRGSVWSRRLINRTQTVPQFEEGAEIPICVQCRDTAAGGLSPDDEIAFAIAVTLEIEAEVQYDIYHEIEQEIRVRLRRGV
ncbi:MAG: S8 family serine peptidase [Bacteroidetes bacterium]|nr:S8 family serine peptidase [Bacteroidota bacterium]